MPRVLYVVGLTAMFFASQGRAAELVLPQGKGAFYAGEAIELAVAGLVKDATAMLELVPQGDGGLGAVSLLVQGDGSTVTFVLPPMTLAPGKYAVRLDGRPSPVEFVVSSGVNNSTMLLSQAANLEDVKPLGGNFILGNAFVFGLIGPDGMPSRDPRGRSAGLSAFDRAVRARPTDGGLHVLDRLRHPQALGQSQRLGRANHERHHEDVEPAHGPTASAIPKECRGARHDRRAGSRAGQDAQRHLGLRVRQLGLRPVVRASRLDIH